MEGIGAWGNVCLIMASAAVDLMVAMYRPVIIFDPPNEVR